MTPVSEIKLIRTDTTLDLSQKAEKVWHKQSVNMSKTEENNPTLMGQKSKVKMRKTNYFEHHPSTCKEWRKTHVCLTHPFQDCVGTSNKYKLCPTKITQGKMDHFCSPVLNWGTLWFIRKDRTTKFPSKCLQLRSTSHTYLARSWEMLP